jgi:alkanesulfonate monooxygenase SsuD/methylene tetrahydromethanopterin reductase-like flavin-dependent oxidoreductase (luciferase family)
VTSRFLRAAAAKAQGADDERQLIHDALEEVELADRLGIDNAWAVEHHFTKALGLTIYPALLARADEVIE